ncbi:MAG: glycosyltransferase family 4 protein [Thermoguttaceae bacterium]|nr:glycosyltransferase family 4 protein [Thermoguttaceae bacterium]
MKPTIVFWKNHPALHDHRLYLALESYYNVLLICDTPTPEKRIRDSGWSVEKGVETLYLSDYQNPKLFVRSCINEHPNAIHVLCGLRSSLGVHHALSYLLKSSSSRFVVCQEAPTKVFGLKKIIQDLIYRVLIFRIRRKVSAFFTMGSMGTEAYTRLGFPSDKIHTSMYSYPGNYPPLPPVSQPTMPIKLIYVGDAIRAKGINLLFEALKSLSAESIHLTLVGSDPEGLLVRAQSDPFLNQRITVTGVVPNKNIIEILSQHDLLILPSLNDGWGMVVTEALIAGIGAIVTDACGSQDVPHLFDTGLVIPAGSVSAIKESLNQVLDNPNLILSWKQNARSRRNETKPEQIASQMHYVLSSVFTPHL